MEDNLMIAECLKPTGEYMRSRQDMNLCITNTHGQLEPGN